MFSLCWLGVEGDGRLLLTVRTRRLGGSVRMFANMSGCSRWLFWPRGGSGRMLGNRRLSYRDSLALRRAFDE